MRATASATRGPWEQGHSAADAMGLVFRRFPTRQAANRGAVQLKVACSTSFDLGRSGGRQGPNRADLLLERGGQKERYTTWSARTWEDLGMSVGGIDIRRGA